MTSEKVDSKSTSTTNQLLERIAKALEDIASHLSKTTVSPYPSTIRQARPAKETQSEIFSETVSETFREIHREQQPVVSVSKSIQDAVIATEKVANHFANQLEQSNLIEIFLATKDIKVKHIPPEEPSDHVINSLSVFIGDHHESLREILAKIKANMQRGSVINFSLKSLTQQEISYTCQLCTRLHEIAFLEQYRYHKAPQYILRAKTTTLPLAQNFFSGKWLERYVLEVVTRTIQTLSTEEDVPVNFSYMLNPQISLPNGDDFELDLIYQINGYFYWIEAKTGDFQQHINKYSRVSKIMELDSKHASMVLTDIPNGRSDDLTALFGMQVYDLASLESGLYQTMKRDIDTYHKELEHVEQNTST